MLEGFEAQRHQLVEKAKKIMRYALGLPTVARCLVALVDCDNDFDLVANGFDEC